jgi:hypothetical protein
MGWVACTHARTHLGGSSATRAEALEVHGLAAAHNGLHGSALTLPCIKGFRPCPEEAPMHGQAHAAGGRHPLHLVRAIPLVHYSLLGKCPEVEVGAPLPHNWYCTTLAYQHHHGLLSPHLKNCRMPQSLVYIGAPRHGPPAQHINRKAYRYRRHTLSTRPTYSAGPAVLMKLAHMLRLRMANGARPMVLVLKSATNALSCKHKIEDALQLTSPPSPCYKPAVSSPSWPADAAS